MTSALQISAIRDFMLLGSLVLLCMRPASADSYVADSDLLPTPYGGYVLQPGIPLAFEGTSAEINEFSWSQLPGPLISSPQQLLDGTWSVDSTFDLVAIMGNPPKRPPGSQALITSISPAPNNGSFSLEIRGFVLIDGDFILRESPTLRSSGVTTIESLPDGRFRIDSFFDIFTELSLDGGQTWHSSIGSMHVTSVPEPSSLALAGVTVLLLVRRARFRRAFSISDFAPQKTCV